MTKQRRNKPTNQERRMPPKYIRLNQQGIPVVSDRAGKPSEPCRFDWEHYENA